MDLAETIALEMVVAELARLVTGIRNLEYHNTKLQLITSREEHRLVYNANKDTTKVPEAIVLILILIVLGFLLLLPTILMPLAGF
jgi:hypothetical protein